MGFFNDFPFRDEEKSISREMTKELEKKYYTEPDKEKEREREKTLGNLTLDKFLGKYPECPQGILAVDDWPRRGLVNWEARCIETPAGTIVVKNYSLCQKGLFSLTQEDISSLCPPKGWKIEIIETGDNPVVFYFIGLSPDPRNKEDSLQVLESLEREEKAKARGLSFTLPTECLSNKSPIRVKLGKGLGKQNFTTTCTTWGEVKSPKEIVPENYLIKIDWVEGTQVWWDTLGGVLIKS